ncbi:MAG: hypothetical protein EOP83_01865 [Verrucomicrobiaceae bacterium]|nr:MAG: hypothetical protein EOP83_01865 [Verrucomicrobiaceae bacterium]
MIDLELDPKELRFVQTDASLDSVSAMLSGFGFEHFFLMNPKMDFVRGYPIDKRDALIRSVMDWCTDQFGAAPRGYPTGEQYPWAWVSLTIGFRQSVHATAFRVRWS